ncbi:hypothetical protein AB0I82_33195 [Streptomyces sp. NPDC050315]|uniref:hypothetical protein n=1 Tax=Streptomyces sp. NPDC050315 TaxID=3155039 RepID=UPI00341BF253
MRLAGYAAPWHELVHAGWLHCSFSSVQRVHSGVAAQLLDAATLAQSPTHSDRVRAAHWALHPAPLGVTQEAPPALQLTPLVLATHTAGQPGSAETDLLTRLCGLSLAQVEDLLDCLLHASTLAKGCPVNDL